VKVGKLGILPFLKGYYIYVGSAMGNRGTSLQNRLKRHLTSSFKNSQPHPHWHIDYFLIKPHVKITAIYILPNQDKREECLLSELLHDYSDNEIQGFGCSDCRCRTHLFYFNEENSIVSFLGLNSSMNLRIRKK
jgi:Uri superfamily endonuclease